MKKTVYLLVLLLLAVIITNAQPTVPGGQIILHCGKLIDVKNKKVLETMSAIIEGNKIAGVP